MEYPLEQTTELDHITIATLDGFTFSALLDRYSLSKSSLNTRIQRLKEFGYDLEAPLDSERRSVYALSQVYTLDALDAHLKTAGSKISTFPRMETQSDGTGQYRTEAIVPGTMIDLVHSLSHIINPADPLANFEALERAAAHGWLLSTSQVRALIGVNPTGAIFIRHGFGFESAGRNGREMAWKITNPRDVARDWSRNE